MPGMQEKFKSTALSFEGVNEAPHFEKISFRINKKIFATLDIQKNGGVVKLSPADQDIFSLYDTKAIYPVPNKWGKQGWTKIDLQMVREDMMTDVLKASFRELNLKK